MKFLLSNYILLKKSAESRSLLDVLRLEENVLNATINQKTYLSVI
jgi:hypothetical protein